MSLLRYRFLLTKKLKDKLLLTRAPRLYVFTNIWCNTNRYACRFLPGATSSWNNLISLFEYFPTYSNIKRYMIKYHRPEDKPFFGIHDPVDLAYLLLLRLGLSPLCSHKNVTAIVTPSDICMQGVGKYS